MNDSDNVLSKDELDYLTEMMNIGAGNAATALSQIIKTDVDMIIPYVRVDSFSKVLTVLEDPSLPVICAKMNMIGDVSGDIFFIVPHEYKETFEQSMVQAGGIRKEILKSENPDAVSMKLSMLAEVGNIVAGVYLTAISDFCKLNIYPTVPETAVDMIQSLLDESIVHASKSLQYVMLIQNIFVVGEVEFKTYLIFVPSVESINVLLDSITQARKMLNE